MQGLVKWGSNRWVDRSRGGLGHASQQILEGTAVNPGMLETGGLLQRGGIRKELEVFQIHNLETGYPQGILRG